MNTVDVLSHIDWYNHDGVNLPMINDFVRNQFYDRVLAENVAGQACTDVGFGTGLLTMLALKHGASHVTAYESDWHRYQLGCEIIEQLKLKHRIELINARYDHSMSATPVTFSETVNGNLWWEGLWNSLPRNRETLFLPGEYFLEIWATIVPDSFAQGLCRSGVTQQYFSPGVDIDPAFVEVINSFRKVSSVVNTPLPQGLVEFRREQETDWGWIPYLRCALAGSIIAKYCIESADSRDFFEMLVDVNAWRDQTVLIVPRMGMQHQQHRLYLDTGHWGPAENPVLLVRPQGNLTVRHSVHNGQLTYELK